MVPEKVVQDWAKNEKRIKDRLNRIEKRIKKYTKQKSHFEMRLRTIAKYKKEQAAKNEEGIAR